MSDFGSGSRGIFDPCDKVDCKIDGVYSTVQNRIEVALIDVLCPQHRRGAGLESVVDVRNFL